MAVLLNKTLMCGGLVVLSPGTPSQVVCAVLIMLFHLLLVLRTAPYKKDSEDFSSIVASLGLTLMYVSALIKMLQIEVGYRSKEDANELDYANGAMTVLPILCISTVVLIIVFVDCGLWNCMRGKKRGETKAETLDPKKSKGGGAQIYPAKRNSFTMAVVKKAIVNEQANIIFQTSEESRRAKLKQLEASQSHASTRVQQRLAKRNKMKSVGKSLAISKSFGKTKNARIVVPIPTSIEPGNRQKNTKAKGSRHGSSHGSRHGNGNNNSASPMQVLAKNRLKQMGRKKVESIAKKLQMKGGSGLLHKKNVALLLQKVGITEKETMILSLKEMANASHGIETERFMSWVFE